MQEKLQDLSSDDNVLAGRYTLAGIIGRGGMSDVYLGKDEKLDRKVAIKVLRSDLANAPAFRARFQQEAQAVSKMTHPNIVRVFDAGEDIIEPGREKTQPFIVMEWVDGLILKDVIDKGPIPVAEALDLTDQLLSALQYSHRAGIVHRDIKPSNVMVTKGNKAKLMDFGIARAVSDSSATVEETTSILGTAQYFSPEQARGETVDARTDLYSLGVVLFEMLTGQSPFQGDSAISVAYQHVNVEPPVPSSINPDIPEAVDRLVLRSITKGRDHRFQSAAEFRSALKAAAKGRRIALPNSNVSMEQLLQEDPAAQEMFREISSGQAKLTGSERRPPMLWLWGGILSVMVLLGAIVYWVLNLSPPEISLKESVKIPALINTDWLSAEKLLTESGLKAIQVTESSDSIAEGKVVRTDPDAGETVNQGYLVNVYVSSGSKKVTVPTLTNRALEVAKEELEKLGLVIGAISQVNSPNIPAGVVIDTSPGKGSLVNPGTIIDVNVSDGHVTLPDLRNEPLATALATVRNLQLVPETRGDTSCTLTAGTPVINQSIAPGPVAQRSSLVLYYCSGNG